MTKTASKKPVRVPTLTTTELIARKRDGGSLTEAEIQRLIAGFTAGDVADYQMSAFAMAVFLRGMSPAETAALTLAMRDSGSVVNFGNARGRKARYVDKHSTGGVGDKVSLCLAPLVAAAGVRVPMVSGRGLGHTGGTLDKLEAIPGFSVTMDMERFVGQVDELGCALIGQTAEIAPADKRLYALRDVTATVESVPLITASILSKKLAEGIDGLVLDVKVGRGAFMKTLEDARTLARSLVRVGTLAGKRVSAILTDMSAPLGKAIGNSLETAEAFEVLLGGGPEDVVECTFVLGAEMLRVAGVAKTTGEARKKLHAVHASGAAIRLMERIVAAQGGDARAVREPDRLPRAPRRVPILAPKAGHVGAIDPLELGLTAVVMGAGRQRAEDAVDPAVGITLEVKLGDKVKKGQPLAHLHVRDEKAAAPWAARALGAFTIGTRAPKLQPLVLETIRS